MSNKNIVLIIVDALRPKDMSLFGYEKETDKYLKELSKESILFRNCFSSANCTIPSITALFTGKYPVNNGVIHQPPYTKESEIQKLKKNKLWFPTFLKNRGYNTIGIDWIGLWLKSGFNYYEEKEEKESGLKTFLNKPYIKKILLHLPNWMYVLGKKMIKTRTSASFPSCNKTIDLSISKIKESKKPFFLFIHFWDTHFPFPTIKKKKGKTEVSDILRDIESKTQREYVKKRLVDIGVNSMGEIKKIRDRSIKDTDKEIGRLVGFLKKNGLWDDTIFIVLSDHGDNFGEHNIYFSHSGLFDESIHVPLIIRLPGIKNKEINELVQNIDIIPTIMDYMNMKKNIDFDGVSMLSLIKHGKRIRKKAFSYDGLSEDIKCIRTKDKKLIIAENNRCQLCNYKHHEKVEEYDLKKDPKELKNIYSGKSELEKNEK